MRYGIVAAAAIGIVAIAGCGSLSEANSHNLPDPNNAHNIRNLVWYRIDTPQNYPTSVYACAGPDGIYESQDAGSSIEVVPNDPRCK